MTTHPLRVWAGTPPTVDVADRLPRLRLNPILRAKLDRRFDDEGSARRYGALLTHYHFTNPADAEVAVLPRALEWSDPKELTALTARAEAHGLRTMVFSGHDLEPVIPMASVILLHPGPTRAAQPHADVLAVPYLFSDRTRPNEQRPDGDRPSVAFCGQGSSRWGAGGIQGLRRAQRRVANTLRPRVVAPPFRGHIGLRASALEALADHRCVDDHFLIRDRYRAGVDVGDDRSQAENEFDDNLRSSTYALCVRGTGNFSARFYEALSFGRVPLFVDTGSVLPFEDEIDWPARTVWTAAEEVDSIADRLVAAHAEVRSDPARSATSLRQLWQEWLTQDGYFAHLPDAVRRLL